MELSLVSWSESLQSTCLWPAPAYKRARAQGQCQSPSMGATVTSGDLHMQKHNLKLISIINDVPCAYMLETLPINERAA